MPVRLAGDPRRSEFPRTEPSTAATGGAVLPAWLQRAAAPFKPMLRPLARKVGLSPKLDAQAENILLAQIEGQTTPSQSIVPHRLVTAES